MSDRYTFQQLIKESKEIVWAPCIYDCVSTKVAEQIGFKAVTISSSEQRHAFTGRPYMTQDEMYISAENIIKSTKCAVLVDGEDGGSTPNEVYRNVKRYAEIGAAAISIEDMFNSHTIGVRAIGVDIKNKSYQVRSGIMPAEIWLANVQAAVDAVKGTDCMVVARVESKGTMDGKGPLKFKDRPGYGLEEAIRRMQMAISVGAQATMCQNICYPGGQEEWKEICSRVPGVKFYPDIHADGGVSDVDNVDELYQLGFNVITCHCFAKGAWKGMIEYGTHVFREKNTIFTENDDFGKPIWQLSPITFEEDGARCDRWIQTMEDYKDFKAK